VVHNTLATSAISTKIKASIREKPNNIKYRNKILHLKNDAASSFKTLIFYAATVKLKLSRRHDAIKLGKFSTNLLAPLSRKLSVKHNEITAEYVKN
jgi:hypothetical protein